MVGFHVHGHHQSYNYFLWKIKHRSRWHNESGKSAHNQGNFRALFDFRVDAGDTLPRDHLSHAPQNSQYQSPSIQNNIITCCGETIQESLIGELVQAQYFAICADEAADSSKKEQLPLVVRFVNDSYIHVQSGRNF